MKKEDIQELKLMEEVSKEGGVTTQRELARRLNISVGLVNTFIKRIVRKGYFKVTTISGRRARYLLTPKGLAEKSRLTISYLQYSLDYYREVRAGLKRLAAGMREDNVRTVALVGTGELAELFSLTMQEAEIEIGVVVAANGESGKFLGRAIRPLADLRYGSYHMVCLMELEDVDAVLERLESLGVPKEKIVIGPSL
jgi:DNA-binding MarR family transcriptional regulator